MAVEDQLSFEILFWAGSILVISKVLQLIENYVGQQASGASAVSATFSGRLAPGCWIWAFPALFLGVYKSFKHSKRSLMRRAPTSHGRVGQPSTVVSRVCQPSVGAGRQTGELSINHSLL